MKPLVEQMIFFTPFSRLNSKLCENNLDKKIIIKIKKLK